MEKREIEVAGHKLTQLDETEYEAENTSQRLDFHFDIARPEAVEVFVFDSEMPTHGGQEPLLTCFYAEDLEDAVERAMSLRRSSLVPTREADIICVSDEVN